MGSEMWPLAGADLGGVLALNNAHAVETSLLDAAKLAQMAAAAFLGLGAGEPVRPDGYLIAFDERADYGSPNFLWFRERYPRFVYVDRIVTAPHARGRGLARAFYARLFAAAREAGQERVVCEVNSEPPNPASAAFHAALGFREVGSAALGVGKVVSYLEAGVSQEVG